MKYEAFPAMFCAATLTLHAEETKTVTLELGKAPVFGSFTNAGVRFPNPSPQMNYLPDSRQGISLTSEPIHLKLTRDGKPIADLGETKVWLSFAGADLKAPGEFYPPALPVQVDTPVSSVDFVIIDEPIDHMDARILALAKDLGTAADSLSVWLKHDLWKHTQSFKAEQSTTLPYSVLTVTPVSSNSGANDDGSGNKDQKPRFSANFRCAWKQPETPNRPGRVIPPPQPGQPARPGVR